MLRFILHKAYNKRQGFNLTKDELEKVIINIITPEFERRDFEKIGEGLKRVSDVLEKAESRKWLSHETAGMIFRSIVDIIGYDIDETTELNKIEQEPAK